METLSALLARTAVVSLPNGNRWIPLTKVSDEGLWCFLWSAPEQTAEQNNGDVGDLRHHRAHYDVTVMDKSLQTMYLMNSFNPSILNINGGLAKLPSTSKYMSWHLADVTTYPFLELSFSLATVKPLI